MKGIIIYGNPMWGDNERATYCEYINNASFELTQYAPKEVISCLKGEALESSKAVCSEDDTYDFETGALIALMKKCGVEKVVRACNEAFSEDTFKTYATMYERELNDLSKKYDKVVKYCDTLRESNKRLQKEKEQIIVAKNILYNKLEKENKDLKKNIDELFESEQHSKSELGRLYFEKHRLEEKVEKLKLDCEKLQHGYNDTDNVPSGHWDGDILDIVFLPGRACGKQYKALVELFKKMDQKKVDAAYKEAYGSRVIWCSSQSSTRDMLDSLLDSCRYAIPTEFTWELKMPTKREKKWERILKLHKENDVIIEVKKEDVTTFLHEIEDKIPEITWASNVKIFETKYTIKDIYDELKTHNRIYFRLSKENKLSYSSDESIYASKGLKTIDYLPPMRWDLFKKGRIIVGVRNNNELEEFRKEVERNTGIKNIPTCPTNLCLFYMFDKDNYKIILNSVTAANIAKINGHKVVYWEDVR